MLFYVIQQMDPAFFSLLLYTLCLWKHPIVEYNNRADGGSEGRAKLPSRRLYQQTHRHMSDRYLDQHHHL